MFILEPRHRVGLNNIYTGFPFHASVAFIVTVITVIGGFIAAAGHKVIDLFLGKVICLA